MKLKKEDIGECWNMPLSRLGHLKSLGFIPNAILDIGAYRGAWSQVIWHVWPHSKYLLIEADQENEPYLKDTGFDYKIALLAEEEKDYEFYKSQTGCGEGNSIYQESSIHKFVPTKVPGKKLSSIVGDDIYDFIKIDCQGAESAIIRGSKEVIQRASFVQLECQILTYNQGAPLAMDVINLMDQLGFRLYDVTEFHYNRFGLLVQADFLFGRKELPIFNFKQL